MVRVTRSNLTQEERAVKEKALKQVMITLKKEVRENHGELHNQRHSQAVFNGL